jgi:1,4-dihydroxy-6-naphthoate synthase
MNYTLGISTCPNDTFMFHALLERKLDTAGLDLSIELYDIQELNERLQRGALHFSKASAAAVVASSDRFEVCSAGAALGFGVGPLLLASPHSKPLSADATVLCPGAMTTAYLLMRKLFPHVNRIEHRVFSEIMPALERGAADYGVVIHEGRFTYRDHGLTLLADLGELWERAEELPLPLGVIAADRTLPEEVRAHFDLLVRRSVAYAFEHRHECLPTMKAHAQELDDQVIWAHVDLYVNQWSLALGDDGERALRAMERAAGANGLVIRRSIGF